MSRLWYRIERRDARGNVEDWVEVGRCVRCGRGVDREFPAEYRETGGVLLCRGCWQVSAAAAGRTEGATIPLR